METKVTAVNGHGHLTIGGLDTVALASKYGTPLYVMDEDAIRANCRALKNSMDAHYHKKGLVLYASKAFCCKRMYRILNEEGLGADVVSGGELYTALQAGFPAERIYFHGNNKTADELTMALESGVGRIVVDNIAELELLGALAKAAGKTASVLFRTSRVSTRIRIISSAPRPDRLQIRLCAGDGRSAAGCGCGAQDAGHPCGGHSLSHRLADL